ncbi:phage-related regulatory protein [Clostridioides difficile]|uniref:conserved phage C-terminal domain-containing protein n=1 Tax=Clostridioides difficile TaxID=1496 RepID=UPI000D1E6B53|nr:conserved phage C-terminal domain-containing protein [Clostridioides difficile]UWD41349.1 conserved phage C-terminal domain-containing protein [Clostridioides difficile]VFF94864.1 phage-related regulatory protein [Clostridioides difficile]VIG13414.1 phage-related regulatory protein [Clostridioides difficile]HBE9438082.1 conserved phage C-terminal domain-containing protein [Clostridioides difficile]HBF4437316.1 conserved phage C-terminal domain-containing protein [Clostridioides difficile]
MSNSFYQLNSAVLYFNEKRDVNRIRFNHYVMRKENIQRLKGTLPRGQFMMTVRKAASDLDVSTSTISRLVNEFIDLGILRLISRGVKGNCCSVYSYVCSENSNTEILTGNSGIFKNIEKYLDVTINNNQKTMKYKHRDELFKNSNTNIYSRISGESIDKDYDLIIHTGYETEKETKKKELLKNNLNKKNLNKNTFENSDEDSNYESPESIHEIIIRKLNSESGKNFKADLSITKALIDKRLKEGYSLEDFYKVIEAKVRRWRYTDMEIYIEPTILFGYEFESYLSEESSLSACNYGDMCYEDMY